MASPRADGSIEKRVAALASMRQLSVGMGLDAAAALDIFAIDYETLAALSKRQWEVVARAMRQVARARSPQTAAVVWLNKCEGSDGMMLLDACGPEVKLAQQVLAQLTAFEAL